MSDNKNLGFDEALLNLRKKNTNDENNINEEDEELVESDDEKEELEVESEESDETPVVVSNRRVPNIDDIKDNESISVELTTDGVTTVSDINGQSTSLIDLPPHRPKSSKATSKHSSNNETVYIRDFPRSLMALIRSEFPDASNVTDALTAFAIVSLGVTDINMSPKVLQLVESHKKDNTSIMSINEQLNDIRKKSSNRHLEVNRKIDELHLGVVWLLFDKIGFRKEHPSSVETANLLEEGVEGLIKRLESQTKDLKKMRQYKEGPPRRLKKDI